MKNTKSDSKTLTEAQKAAFQKAVETFEKTKDATLDELMSAIKKIQKGAMYDAERISEPSEEALLAEMDEELESKPHAQKKNTTALDPKKALNKIVEDGYRAIDVAHTKIQKCFDQFKDDLLKVGSQKDMAEAIKNMHRNTQTISKRVQDVKTHLDKMRVA